MPSSSSPLQGAPTASLPIPQAFQSLRQLLDRQSSTRFNRRSRNPRPYPEQERAQAPGLAVAEAWLEGMNAQEAVASAVAARATTEWFIIVSTGRARCVIV